MLVYRGYHLQKFRPLTRAIKGDQFQLEAEVQQALGDHHDTTQYFKKGIQCMASQKQKNDSGSNAYISTSNIFLLITLIQISVESPTMRHMLLVGLFRGCLSIVLHLPWNMVTMKITVYWGVTLCSLMDMYQHLGGTCGHLLTG